MAQIKIYGHRGHLSAARKRLSDTIHECSVSVLGIPGAKRFHRFIALDKDDFIHPADRSEQYVIIEVMLMSGRTAETRKKYLNALMERVQKACGIPMADIEVVLIESPRENWGIRGRTGDELQLTYDVEV